MCQDNNNNHHSPRRRRRRNLLFSPMSISPDTTTTTSSSSSSSSLSSDLFLTSLPLPNGNFYSGQCSSSLLPHGTGKHLWTDGSMYSGDWRLGLPSGHGKLSLPSGDTYQGHFKSGLIHGHGRYLCSNGNHYSGQWRHGVIHGNGSFIWANGNRFDGGWVAGRPVGSGRFRWADGSLYVGLWNKDSEEEKDGLYYPSLTATDVSRNPKEFFVTALRECRICGGESFSQKFMCFDGGEKGNGEVWDSGGGVEEGRRSSCSSSSRNQLPVRVSPRPERRQGVAISKGHKNYELMLNLQLGIR